MPNNAELFEEWLYNRLGIPQHERPEAKQPDIYPDIKSAGNAEETRSPEPHEGIEKQLQDFIINNLHNE